MATIIEDSMADDHIRLNFGFDASEFAQVQSKMITREPLVAQKYMELSDQLATIDPFKN